MSGDQGLFDTLRTGLTVAMIQTRRDDLVTCRAGDEADEEVRRNDRRDERYDYLPVENDKGAIVGFFRATDLSLTGELVSCRMDQLSDDTLVGEDASILDFIDGIDAKPYRLVVAGGGITGIVTWSDLQKLPVRVALFGLITGLEIEMSGAIRCRYRTMYSSEPAWMQHLDGNERRRIQGRIRNSRENDSEVDALLYTDICHKAKILNGIDCPEPWVDTAHGDEFAEINDLRNEVAHARDYATSREKANHVRRVVRNLVRIREEVVTWRRDRENCLTATGAPSRPATSATGRR